MTRTQLTQLFDSAALRSVPARMRQQADANIARKFFVGTNFHESSAFFSSHSLKTFQVLNLRHFWHS